MVVVICSKESMRLNRLSSKNVSLKDGIRTMKERRWNNV